MLIVKPNILAAGGGPCDRISVFNIFDEHEKIGQTSLYVTDHGRMGLPVDLGRGTRR